MLGNWVQETTSTSGTGIMTLVAVADQTEFIDAVAEGIVVDYAIIDDNGNKEVGRGTTGASKTLARTTVLATLVSGVYDNSSPAAITLSGSATVYLTIAAENIVDKYDAQITNHLIKTGADLRGTATDNHVNLSSGTTYTGTAAQAYDFITIGGGVDNTAIREYGTIGGGRGNILGINSNYAFIGGGYLNKVNTNAAYAVVGGGLVCIAQGSSSVVGGGESNTAKNAWSTISGGNNCITGGNYATVVGGRGNRAQHTHSVAMGGGSYTRETFDLVLGATDTITPDVLNNTIRFQGTGGNILMDGTVSTPEADIGEMLEWVDGNENNEDRIGFLVSLLKGKIKIGNENPVGIISATASLVGNAAPNKWQGIYLRDEWKRKLYDEYELLEWLGDDGRPEHVYRNSDGIFFDEYPQPTSPDGIKTIKQIPDDYNIEIIKVRRMNPDFDISRKYIPRADRKEWSIIGVNGLILARASSKIKTWKVDSLPDGTFVDGTTYNVTSKISDKIIEVFYK